MIAFKLAYGQQHTYMGEIWNTQKETYRVQNIGLAAAVQSCDGVEEWVKAVDLRPLRVGLESFDNNRLDVHLSGFLSQLIPEARFVTARWQTTTLNGKHQILAPCLQPTTGKLLLLSSNLNFGGRRADPEPRVRASVVCRKQNKET